MSRPVNVIPSREARAHLGTMLSRFRAGDNEPMYFGAHRKPEAAVIPFERYMQLLDLEERWAAEDQLVDQVRRRIAEADATGNSAVVSLPLEDLAAQLGPAAADMLEEIKADDDGAPTTAEIDRAAESVKAVVAKLYKNDAAKRDRVTHG